MENKPFLKGCFHYNFKLSGANYRAKKQQLRNHKYMQRSGDATPVA